MNFYNHDTVILYEATRFEVWDASIWHIPVFGYIVLLMFNDTKVLFYKYAKIFGNTAEPSTIAF